MWGVGRRGWRLAASGRSLVGLARELRAAFGLAEFLVAEGVVDDISHEGLRTFLREEGVSFQVMKTFK
jgi:hypothetical protein